MSHQRTGGAIHIALRVKRNSLPCFNECVSGDMMVILLHTKSYFDRIWLVPTSRIPFIWFSGRHLVLGLYLIFRFYTSRYGGQNYLFRPLKYIDVGNAVMAVSPGGWCSSMLRLTLDLTIQRRTCHSRPWRRRFDIQPAMYPVVIL